MSSKHAHADHPAYRYPSEDRIIVLETARKDKVYCIFDGHSGQGCVNLVSRTLPKKIVERIDVLSETTVEEVQNILLEEFASMEEMCMSKLSWFDGGCTAVVSVVSETHIITANIGDSPAILFTKTGEYLASTPDHDCKNECEIARVKGEGGWFSDENPYREYRLYNCFALTRCFGNRMKKITEYGLSATPDITVWERKPETMLSLCSDSFTEIQGVRKGSPLIYNGRTHQQIVSELMITVSQKKFELSEVAALAVKYRIDQFYNSSLGVYQGDNTSLILVDLDRVQIISPDSSFSSDEFNPEST